jgi:hypothetical protein
LVNTGDLRLKDGNSITNGWLFVSNSRGSESSGGEVQKVLVFVSDKLGQHFRLSLKIILNIKNLRP